MNEENNMSNQMPPMPVAEPVDYPVSAPAAPAKKSGTPAGILIGAAVIALLAGMLGGAIGFAAAKDSLGTSDFTSSAAAPISAPAKGSIAAVAAAIQPSVVQMNVTGPSGSGTGSGFVLNSDGYILTNNHVAGMAGSTGSIEVQFADGSTAQGKLVGANPGYDLAVVKVNRTGLKPVTLGKSGQLQVGDSVIAIGSPLGLQGTVTSGIVSSLNRPVTSGGDGGGVSFMDAIQTDAAINPGNSGGPLVDGNGQVIGVNSAIASTDTTGSGQPGSIGLGFAIPIDTAKRIAQEIVTTGHSTTPVIGVQLDTTFAGPGAKVSVVTPGGASDAAGIQPGDVIIKIDGKTVTDSTDLVVAIRAHNPGDKLNLDVLRNGSPIQVPLTLKGTTS